jgi:transposase
MWNTWVDTGSPGQEILHACVVKEELRTILTLSGTHPECHLPRRALHRFHASAATSSAPQIHRIATTIETWWPAIQATIPTGHTNTRTEGHNRLVKHEGPNASGFNNPTNQRHRIRRARTPQHREGPVTTTELPAQIQ